MIKACFDYYFNFFNVESWTGLFRLIIWAAISMVALRYFVNPESVVFPTDHVHKGDYESMIVMGSLLIALDAMLLVALNFRRLSHPLDALILALMVGGTHVIFPLFTFALAAGAYIPFRDGWLPLEYSVLSIGIVSAIYYIATHFVLHHLREVLGNLYNLSVEEAPEGLRSWKAIKEAWPTVLAVSIDALIVGPAKVAFMDRYEQTDFIMSFVYIGIGVFTLVLLSSLCVILMQWLLGNHMEKIIQSYDYWSSILLVMVFYYFAIFAFMYLLYTFWPQAFLLQTETLRFVTGCIALIFFIRIDRSRLRRVISIRSSVIQKSS